jgi:hypothetical protein
MPSATESKQEKSTRRFVGEHIISEISNRKVRTLQKDRLLRRGPFPYYHIGRQVVYDIDEVIAIIEASRSRSGDVA